MIDPTNMTNYERDDWELEEMIFFCVCVAGKNAMTTARGLESFLSVASFAAFVDDEPPWMPFKAIDWLFSHGINVAVLLKDAGIGCYNHRAQTFRELIKSDFDLKTCTVDDLETVKGIGMKTSRFFILHSPFPEGCRSSTDRHARLEIPQEAWYH
jgi:hypothetical protein